MNLFEQDFVIHSRESNPESQKILEANRKRLSKNCKSIFDKLMDGRRLTSFNCGLVDFRRRICDLKENGVMLSSIGSEDETRCKIWYMTEDQKKFNKKFL